MDIFVGGSLREVPRDEELCREFVEKLGVEIVKQGHVLLNGCRGSLDEAIAGAAHKWLIDNKIDPRTRIVGYCLKTDKPQHSFGTVRYSALNDWNMDHSELVVPEQIRLADATIFVSGGNGTNHAKNWAQIARKPILGIPRFGGAGETIYMSELKRYEESFPEIARDYETLNSVSDAVSDLAVQTVRLAARLVTPGNVFIVMSFKTEFRDTLASYKEVCKKFGFEAERTDESTSLDRILPRIEIGIQNSAFVIADISSASQNVFYELGYAKALGKQVVVTAKKGTELPFDVTDIPIIFWEDQTGLKQSLEKILPGVTAGFGRKTI